MSAVLSAHRCSGPLRAYAAWNVRRRSEPPQNTGPITPGKGSVKSGCCLLYTSVDLIVTDVTPQLKETIPRLVETGLFTRVIFGEVQALNRKFAAVKEEGLSEGFRNRDRLLRWVLNEKPAEYEEIYFANFDPFLRMLAGLYYDSPCECIWYEDGFSSYVIDYLREDRALINRCLLYTSRCVYETGKRSHFHKKECDP